jgi:hypothetical protein
MIGRTAGVKIADPAEAAQELASRCLHAAQTGKTKLSLARFDQAGAEATVKELERLIPGLECRWESMRGWVAHWEQAPAVAHEELAEGGLTAGKLACLATPDGFVRMLAQQCVRAARAGETKLKVMNEQRADASQIARELERLVPGLECRHQGDFGWFAHWRDARSVLSYRGVDSDLFHS